MAWIRRIASLAAALALCLSISLPVCAINTVPDLPPLEETTDAVSQSGTVPSEPESQSALPVAEDDNGMIYIGIIAWVGFLAVAAVVAVVIVKSKKRPPGGGTGGLSGASPGNEGYKERILSDQHYRKY